MSNSSIVPNYAQKVDGGAAVEAVAGTEIKSSGSRCLRMATLCLITLQVISVIQIRRQYIQMSRLEHENQLLLSNQDAAKQSCTVSLESLRKELQTKFDNAFATSNRIHQLELDK